MWFFEVFTFFFFMVGLSFRFLVLSFSKRGLGDLTYKMESELTCIFTLF